MADKSNKHDGSSFDGFMKEQGMGAIIVITQFPGGWDWKGHFDSVGAVRGHNLTLIGALGNIIDWAEPIEMEIEADTAVNE